MHPPPKTPFEKQIPSNPQTSQKALNKSLTSPPTPGAQTSLSSNTFVSIISTMMVNILMNKKRYPSCQENQKRLPLPSII
jgi:formiminotetrahydrofolate cyclodeaminase